MTIDTVSLSVSNQGVTMGTCELCITADSVLNSIVTVQHNNGALVRFVSCDRCARAARRIVAAIGSDSQLSQVVLDPSPSPTYPKAVPRPRLRRKPRVQTSEMLLEVPNHLIIDEDGRDYIVQVWGGRRSDGMWVGWLEFVQVGTLKIRRTGQETTQPDRDALLYWASGHRPAYFEGAFERAR